jgi:hypothetical protein
MSIMPSCALAAFPRVVAGAALAVSLLPCSLAAFGDSGGTKLSKRSATLAAKTGGERPTTDQREKVKERLLELFNLCKAGEHDKAAAYFVYRGPDKKREWKDVFKARDPQERKAVEGYCRRIKGYLDQSTGYGFGEFTISRESEGEWNVWEFIFKRGEQSRKVYFAFLKVKGKYAIGDID